MILSVPFSILLQALLLNCDNASAAFMKPSPSFRQMQQTSSSQLNVDVDPIVSAYRRKGRAPLDDIKIPSADTDPAPLPTMPEVAAVTPEPIIVPPEPIAVSPETVSIPDVVPDATQSVTPSFIDSVVEAVNNAAASAVEASNKASEAAASLSPPAAAGAGTAAATKTVLFPKAKAAAEAAAAASSVERPKAPSLVEYLSSGKPMEDISLPPDAKEKLHLLGENFMKSGESFKIAIPTDATEKLSAVASSIATTTSPVDVTQVAKQVTTVGASAGAAAAISTPSFDFSSLDYNFNFDSIDVQTFINNLKLDEYGGWYATAFTFVYALSQKNAGRSEAEKNFESEISNAREAAQDAARAAIMAAEGAKAAKHLVTEMAKEDRYAFPKPSGSHLVLEESKKKWAEIDYEMMKGKVEQLSAENREQKITIERLVAQKNSATPAGKKANGVQVPVVKETMERDPKEDEKILEVLKEMDDERAAAKAAAAEAEEAFAAAEKIQEAARAAAAEAEEALAAAKKIQEAAAKSKKEKTTRKTKKKKTPTPKIAPEVDEALVQEIMKIDADAEATADSTDSSSFFVKTPVEEELVKITSKPKKAPAKKKAPRMKASVKKKSPAKKKAAKRKTSVKKATSADSVNPWGSLKESTLKRKTIAELSAYLEERKVTIEGMSKTQLVGTIQTLKP